MKVRITLADDKDVVVREFDGNETQQLIEAVQNAVWYGTTPSGQRLPKGVEVAPV